VDPSITSPALQWLPSLLGMIAAETAKPQPGSEAVVTRLCDILVISAIRTWLDTDPAARTGWLGALQDPQIGPAVARIHREPERAWTVAERLGYASEAAFSRAYKRTTGPAPGAVRRGVYRDRLAETG
jgi:AraC-like DNA-binding protein